MDYDDTLARLYAQLERVTRAIQALEELKETSCFKPRRRGKKPGRKSMNEEEKQEVSERMKRYWSTKRLVAARDSPTNLVTN